MLNMTGDRNMKLDESGVNIGASKTKEGFNLFTHQQKRKLEGTGALVLDYDSLRQAVLELYLSVKIRSDDEIDEYSKDLFEKEKREQDGVNGYDLIDYIKQSIEVLMNMKMEETEQTDYEGYGQKGGRYQDIEDPDINV